jgi:hypothetical protein
MEEARNAYNSLVRKPQGKRSLVRPRCRWEDLRMDFREIGWEGVVWFYVAQDRDQWQVRPCEHSNEPLGSINGGEYLE